MAMIDVAGIGKAYPSSTPHTARGPRGARVEVLRDIALRVEHGSVLGLLGPNGAGKTTLIKILAGLLRPDRGGGRVLGYDLLRQHHEIRARVSLVAPTADVGIDNNLTVYQNLAFWAPIYGLRGAQARARIDELLAQLDLVAKASAWPMHISAGQRQRLALARSLLARNRLVFLDEPTNKLDLEGVRSVRALIADLNQHHGVTIVLTTHVMEEAEELCDDIALLRLGVLVAHQPTDALTRSLGLARPITLTLRRPTADSAAPPDAPHTPDIPDIPDIPDAQPPPASPASPALPAWCAALSTLPGITHARLLQSPPPSPPQPEPAPHEIATARSSAAAPSDVAPHAPPDTSPDTLDGTVRFVLDSLDLRATTPTLLAWVRAHHLQLVSMQAEPVTLDDVFKALAGVGPTIPTAQPPTSAPPPANTPDTLDARDSTDGTPDQDGAHDHD